MLYFLFEFLQSSSYVVNSCPLNTKYLSDSQSKQRDYHIMAFQTAGVVAIAFIYLLIRYFNRTDTPKVKGIPEIPGYPIFGSLLEFGSSHAKVAGTLAEKYGPVFQVRLGNRV